ncbi:uncharacterized protein MELLADRAFT_114743 [Melampsora larici-populina 98AG31]|uniref:Uncharacterized protein n=1 Tax=Melampsora larici-populina (strain 98AG31 / pathotype 3-4-7) TaxID=747676 RepID=F4SEL3_MELLP|nr:uncharacterized protein MELLADRAFT_114743 [Melampsora larici-populina 98AG31]EGF96913.1 hypothetical protein MELLADRAFT_114743 [Melampsora larici-populina 98AG31]
MADWNPPPHPRSRNEPEHYGNLQSTSASRPGTDGPRSKIGSRAGSTASSKQRVNEGRVFNGNLEVLDSNIRDFSNESGSKFSEVLKKEFHLLEVVNAQYKELYKVIRQDNKDVSSLNKKVQKYFE